MGEIGKMNQASLIQELSHIKFRSLQVLAIQDNRIESIELFESIWWPEMLSLGVERNRIRSMKNMRKASVRKLRELGVAGNCILDLHALTSFMTTSMAMLGVETSGLKEQSPDICWLGKLQTPQLSDLCAFHHM